MENPESDIQAKARKYSRINQTISIVETLIFFIILLVLILSGLSKYISYVSSQISSNPYFAFLIFVGITGLLESIIDFPLDLYSGYILEHKYNLSNQTLFKYFFEKAKSLLVGMVIGIPLLLIFYYVLVKFDNNWWLVFYVALSLFSLILGVLAPVLILPIFYKFKPIENESLKNRILGLCSKLGVKIKGIYVFDMSKNTKKANAAFTGLGKSKRIIIGDTLIEKFTEDEIESVFAHEVGHYLHRHIKKQMSLSSIITFFGLYFTALVYNHLLIIFNFSSVYDLAALPLLTLLIGIYSLFTKPISNIYSRKHEKEADKFALDITGNNEAFISAMEKLAEQNLADKTPNKVIEFLFHSHPSLQKRIEFARNYKK